MTDTAQTTPEGQRPIGEILESNRSGEQAASPPAAEPASLAKREREGNRLIAHGAFHAEREKRREYQKRVTDLELELEGYRQAEEMQHQQPDPGDKFWGDPVGYISQREANTNLRISKAEFRAEHGKDTLDALETAIGEAMKAGNPDLPVLRDMMLRSDDPTRVAYDWWLQNGGDRVVAGMRSPGRGNAFNSSAFPSNLAGARNVGNRSGPAWSGPPTLQDIFKR